MNPLQEHVAALIRANGPLTTAQFMTIALHDPNHGYYAKADPIGAKGDFITAPEISQVFGELIGLWCAQVWLDQGKHGKPQLVEMGPGRGTLMADALRALRVMPEFLDALRVTLVETSPLLRNKQQDVLKHASVPIEWRSGFDGSNAEGPLFLIANEFFDALPIRQFVRAERCWSERLICARDDGSLYFGLSPALSNDFVPGADAKGPPGTVFESCESGSAIAQEIGRSIHERGGAALFIDYGYDSPAGGETLQAVSHHRYASLLTEAGRCDLSAHVNFRALAIAAGGAGASVHGPVSQREFLLSLGIAERAQRLAQSGHREVMTALDRLTNPDQMGTLFKVLAIAPEDAAPPPGFQQ